MSDFRQSHMVGMAVAACRKIKKRHNSTVLNPCPYYTSSKIMVLAAMFYYGVYAFYE